MPIYDSPSTYDGPSTFTPSSSTSGMSAILENLIIRRDKIALELAEITSKPDYSIDGQSVQWTAHRKSLLDELKELNELILAYDPYELQTIGT